MSKAYRARKGLHRFAVASLVVALIGGAGMIAGMFQDPAFRAEGFLGKAIFFVLLWSFFVAVAICQVLAYRLYELTFGRSTVKETTLLGSEELAYAEVDEVRWGRERCRRVEILSAKDRGRPKKLAIDLSSFEPADSLRLIRALRASLSSAEHRDWERFCRNYAIPLRDAANGVKRPLRSDEQRLTRRRWDVIFATSIVVCGLVAAGVASATGDASPFVMVAILAGAWTLFHFAWPREGTIVRRRSPEEKRWLWILVAASVLLLAGLSALLAIPFLPLPPIADSVSGLWAFGAFLAWFSVVCWASVRLGELQKEREAVEPLGAADEWEEGEQIVFVERR